jgi:polyisoprenoid-binding protein YceI
MKLLAPALLVAGLAGLSAAFSAGDPAPRAAAPETYTLDSGHSTVIFHTKHMGISEAYGRFNTISEDSELVLDADLTRSSLRVVVEAESVDTGLAERDKHLRNADFFNAKEHPEIVFESRKITGKPDALEVSGELTFLGVKKSVTARAHQVGKGDTVMGHRVGFVAELSVSMLDFGVALVKSTPGAVGPDVHLTISLECVRK